MKRQNQTRLNLNAAIEKGYVLRKMVTEAPYREGTNRYKRFSVYRNGMAIEKALESKKVNRDGLRGDIHRGYVKLVRKPSRHAH